MAGFTRGVVFFGYFVYFHCASTDLCALDGAFGIAIRRVRRHIGDIFGSPSLAIVR
jgi:hypothetical protein